MTKLCPICKNSMTYHKPTQKWDAHWICKHCQHVEWVDNTRLPDAFDRWYRRYKPYNAPELRELFDRNDLLHLAERKFEMMLRCAWEASKRRARKHV